MAARACPTAPYSHVDDLLALIDFLGARPVHLVGLSLGGRVALRVAAQQPEAVRSLTLADPAMDGHAWSGDWLQRWRKHDRRRKTRRFRPTQRHYGGSIFCSNRRIATPRSPTR